MHSDLMHPDIVLEDFKAHQRELWREAERQLLARQVQPHIPQWGAPRLWERNAAITSRCAEHVPEYSAAVPQRVLVPFDWSAPAYQALEEALALAKPCRAHLTLLYVLYFPPRAAAFVAPYMAAIEDRIGQALDALLQRVQDAGVEGRGLLVHGVPWQKIVDVAQAMQADLIVMGTHGRTGLSRLLLGSVAASVQRHAPCPVRMMVETQSMRVGQVGQGVEGASCRAMRCSDAFSHFTG
jgi:nucleotide-binding universal stress UspA family protein